MKLCHNIIGQSFAQELDIVIVSSPPEKEGNCAAGMHEVRDGLLGMEIELVTHVASGQAKDMILAKNWIMGW